MNAIQTTIAGVFVALFARAPKTANKAEQMARNVERIFVPGAEHSAGYYKGFGEGYDAGYEAGLRVSALAEKQTLTAVLRILESQSENAADSVKQLLAFQTAA